MCLNFTGKATSAHSHKDTYCTPGEQPKGWGANIGYVMWEVKIKHIANVNGWESGGLPQENFQILEALSLLVSISVT